MKFEIDRLAMLEAAKNMARVAPTGAPVEVLRGVLVEGNEDTADVFMTATNHEQSIQQKVKASVAESGSMLVNARLLVGMLSLLAGEFVTFTAVKPEVLTVSGGTCRYDINCLPTKHYPKPIMPFPEETVKISSLCSLAKRTVFAVSKDEHKPALQCVSIKLKHNAVHAAACDGNRLMMVRDSSGSPDEREFLLPGRALHMLASMSKDSDVFDVGDVGNEVAFMRNDMLFTMRKLPGEYIDTTSILKGVAPAYSAITNAREMREALDVITVGITSNEPVNVVLSRGQVILRRNTDYSEAHTSITANILKDTPEDGFYYSANDLVKLFQVLDGRIKLEIDAKGVMLVKSRSEVYLQLARRAPVKKAKKTAEAKDTNDSKKAA